MLKISDLIRSEYKCTLSAEMLRRAREELNEVEDRRLEDVEHLRSWLAKQKHIICRQDDRFLLMFLRGCKFSLQRSKEKLDLYHSLITHCPEQARPEDPMTPMLQRALSCGAFVPLPQPLPNGQGVVIVRAGKRDPTLVSQDCMFKLSNMISQLWQESSEQLQVCGVVGIIDLEGVTVAHAADMTPTCIKKASVIWDAFPTRQKGMHYFNTPQFIDPILNLFRTFLSEKLKNRIYVHSSDLASLHKTFPPDCLPLEYGGNLGSIDAMVDEWKNIVENNRDHFLAAKKFGVDEKLRPGQARSSADYLGIEGSFRKLEID